MSSSYYRALIALSVAFGLGVASFGPTAAAQRATVAIVDSSAGEVLEAALAKLDQAEPQSALDLLATLDTAQLSPYERGRLEQLQAQAEHGLGRPAAAREHLLAALASGGLNEQEQSAARYEIGQLYVAEQRWPEAVTTLEAWLAMATEPPPAAYYALAISYYQLGDYGRALPLAEHAVTASSQAPASWLELMAALRLQRREFAAALPWLERLVERAPEHRDYWLQLSSAYQALGQYDRALAAMQLPYSAGLLTADAELRRLVDLLLYNGLPQRAAEVLERALTARSGKDAAEWHAKLAEAWVMAGEPDRAVAPLERAAQLTPGAAGYVRLAELHVERHDWAAALAALDVAAARGEPTDPAQAALLRGVALFGAHEFPAAREWLVRAAEAAAYQPLASRYIEVIDARSS